MPMINTEGLHFLTQRALREASWFPERHVPTREWYDSLTGSDYKWSGAAERFLASLGDLVIHPIKSQESIFGSGTLVTDPTRASGEYERIAEREKSIGESLCPVGEWSGEYIVLIAPSSRVYAEMTYQVLLLGQTVEEALDVMVRAHRYPELVQGRVWWAK